MRHAWHSALHASLKTNLTVGLCLMVMSCATVVPPNGGPEDKTPPAIDSSAFALQRTNFHEKSIGLHFSEYVDKSRVNESIMLSPERRMEFSWSGKDLEINFPEGLDSATTYALTLGTDYADLHGNKPSQSYTLVFSTGARLDSASIVGELIDPAPSGCYLYLYKLADAAAADTLDPSTTKARYRTQVGTNGSFEFRALPYGSYRLFAVRDVAKDGLYTPGADALGTTSGPLVLNSSLPVRSHVRLGQVQDLQAPQLVEVRPRSRRRIDLVFSELMDTSSIHRTGFVITDSISGKNINVRAAFLSTQAAQNCTVLCSDVETPGPYIVRVATDSSGPRDLGALHLVDSLARMTFRASRDSDQTVPGLVQLPLTDSSRGVALKPTWKFLFSTAIGQEGMDQHCGLFKLNQRVPCTLSWASENCFTLSPVDSLLSDSWYEVRFRSTGLTDLFGLSMPDTVYRWRFHTVDTRPFGTISGAVVDSSGSSGPYIVTLYMKTHVIATRTLLTAGSFSFDMVPEGEYSLDVYCDSDRNGRYSAGQAKPFVYAERFSQRSAGINLKARWSVDDVRLVIPSASK